MQKKEYIQPEMEMVAIRVEGALLIGSAGTGLFDDEEATGDESLSPELGEMIEFTE